VAIGVSKSGDLSLHGLQTDAQEINAEEDFRIILVKPGIYNPDGDMAYFPNRLDGHVQPYID